MVQGSELWVLHWESLWTTCSWETASGSWTDSWTDCWNWTLLLNHLATVLQQGERAEVPQKPCVCFFLLCYWSRVGLFSSIQLFQCAAMIPLSWCSSSVLLLPLSLFTRRSAKRGWCFSSGSRLQITPLGKECSTAKERAHRWQDLVISPLASS